MPVSVAFQEPRTFMVCASGRVTFDEVQVTRATILSHPRLSGAYMLVDGRTVSAAPSGSELRRIAAEMLPMVEGGLGPIAIVTDSPMVYGVARMFATFAEVVHATVMPFRCMNEAEDWLAERAAPGSSPAL